MPIAVGCPTMLLSLTIRCVSKSRCLSLNMPGFAMFCRLLGKSLPMQRSIDHHKALIYTMVLVSAAEGVMTDAEIETIGRLVRYLPVFADFDHDQLTEVGRDCTYLLRQEDGLDQAFELISKALPAKLRETAYALACDVAAADGQLADEELNLLHMLQDHLGVDALIATAIERSAHARHASL